MSSHTCQAETYDQQISYLYITKEADRPAADQLDYHHDAIDKLEACVVHKLSSNYSEKAVKNSCQCPYDAQKLVVFYVNRSVRLECCCHEHSVTHSKCIHQKQNSKFVETNACHHIRALAFWFVDERLIQRMSLLLFDLFFVELDFFERLFGRMVDRQQGTHC